MNCFPSFARIYRVGCCAVSPTAFFPRFEVNGKQMWHKYRHVKATGDRHWTFLTTPDHAIYVNLLTATNNDLRRARSLIHCRHFCIHWSQAESFHELFFQNTSFFLALNPSWNYFKHSSRCLEFSYCTCHFFLHFKYLFYLFLFFLNFSLKFLSWFLVFSCKLVHFSEAKYFYTRPRELDKPRRARINGKSNIEYWYNFLSEI